MRKQCLISNYLLIFSAAITIVTCCLGFSYSTTVSNLKSNIEKLNEKTITQTYRIFEGEIDQIRKTVFQIAISSQTNYVISLNHVAKGLEPNDILLIQQTANYLRNICSTSNQIVDIQIYSKNSGYCFGPSGMKSYTQWAKDAFETEKNKQPFDPMMVVRNSNTPNQLLEQRIYYKNRIPTMCIPYVQELPFTNKKDFNGVIFIFLDKSKLLEGLSSSINFETLLVQDKNKNFITFLGNTDDILLQENATAKILMNKSDFAKMTINRKVEYVTVRQPNENLIFSIFSKTPDYFASVQLFGITFYFMLGMSIITLLVTFKRIMISVNKPIKKLLYDNGHLNELLEKQKNNVQFSILNRLLFTDNYPSKNEIIKSLKLVSICPEGKKYCVLLIAIAIPMKGSKEENEFFHILLIKNGIKDKLKDIASIYTVDTAYNNLTLICEFPEDEVIDRKIDILANDIYQFVKTNFQTRTYYSCGTPYEIIDINASYAEALSCLSDTEEKSCSLIHFNNKTKISMIRYSADIEQRLMICVKSGDPFTLQKILKNIHEENFVHIHLSRSSGILLIAKLKATLLGLCNALCAPQTEIYESITRYVSTTIPNISFENDFQIISNYILHIEELVSYQHKSHAHILKQQLVEFIDENCFLQKMSLTLVADKFHISESYLSTFFKDQMGINFQSYIEKRRLTKACDLMKSKDININAIAHSIGYANSHSFRRAFKREFGTNPMNYMKSLV